MEGKTAGGAQRRGALVRSVQRTMLGEVAARVADFDELPTTTVSNGVRSTLCAATVLTPVPLSTTRGIDGSIVEGDALAGRYGQESIMSAG